MHWAIDRSGQQHWFQTIDQLFDFINANDIVEGYVEFNQ